MLAILNSLNAHNFPILQSILMILVSNSRFIELFLIRRTYNRVAVHFNVMSMFLVHKVLESCY